LVETTSLYDGAILLEFDSAKHQYRVIKNGRRYKVPSVTGIVSVLAKPALIQWAANSSVELCKGAISPGVEYSETYLEEVWRAARKASGGIKSEAASKGTEIHRALEASFRGGDGDSGTNVTVKAVRDCLDALHIRPLESERKIYSCRHRYSGTLDLLGETDGKLVLVDFKTSKGIYPEFRLQTAAYVFAYEEETKTHIDSRVILQIADTGEVTSHAYNKEAQKGDFLAFLGALRLKTHIDKLAKNKVQK
jgi:hypothetical protein